MKKEIIGESEHIKYLHDRIKHAATGDVVVLIQGPTGTGKELVAHNIHDHDKNPRKKHSFQIMNCAAIPENLFESELFGHKKGAFTGAFSDKKGIVELANGGTLFLDEIGNLISSHQGKILRFLEDGSYCPAGGRSQKVDVRIIAATNKNLSDEVDTENFRDDLFHRLNGLNIDTEPLATRPEDIICLINHLAPRRCTQDPQYKEKPVFDARAKILLYSYDFPGNVRELEKLIELSDYSLIRENLEKARARIGKNSEDHVDPFTEALSLVDRADVDFKKVVAAYEIIMLYQRSDLSQTKIVETLHIKRDIGSSKGFQKHFGFDFPQSRTYYMVDFPIDVYPQPVSEPVTPHSKGLMIRMSREEVKRALKED